jgi:hypothetical protein
VGLPVGTLSGRQIDRTGLVIGVPDLGNARDRDSCTVVWNYGSRRIGWSNCSGEGGFGRPITGRSDQETWIDSPTRARATCSDLLDIPKRTYVLMQVLRDGLGRHGGRLSLKTMDVCLQVVLEATQYVGLL